MAVGQNDILRVAARLKDYHGNDVVNVFHVKYVGEVAVPDSDALDHMASYMEAIYSPLVTRLSNTARFFDINVFNVSQKKPLGSVPWPTLTNGSGTGDVLPSQLAAMVRGTTDKSRLWARKFFGPFAEPANTDEGKIANSWLANLAQAGAAWLDGYTWLGATYIPVVYWSKANLWIRLVSIVIRNIWSTLRRRRVGRGA